ncbi:MAG: hypothetical protein LBL17_04605 [Coxiellaceae bacterium]|nr:hypothetical protein [Coxiellaceae bacterium]
MGNELSQLHEAFREIPFSEETYYQTLKTNLQIADNIITQKTGKRSKIHRYLDLYQTIADMSPLFNKSDIAQQLRHGRYGDVALAMCDSILKYLTDKNTRNILIQSITSHDEIQAILQTSNIVFGLQDPAILLLQRLMKYRLLLKEILKTGEDIIAPNGKNKIEETIQALEEIIKEIKL